MAKEIDWAALLEGQEAESHYQTSGISGLLSVNSDLDTTLSESTRSPKYKSSLSARTSESGSFANLQSINDLMLSSPSPEPHGRTKSPFSPEPYRSQSQTSIKSIVSFSEAEPEVFNIAEEMNLLSVGDLTPSEHLSVVSSNDGVSYNTRDFHSESIGDEDAYTAIETEEQSEVSESDISEEIKTKSDVWGIVKQKTLKKQSSIPVFMVPKKKQKRDLSIKTVDGTRSEVSLKTSRRRSSARSETSNKSYNYTTFTEATTTEATDNITSVTEDITTVTESSDLESYTKQSVTKIKFKKPCCKCVCKCQTADLNINPIPLSGITLDPKTLAEISEMNPDKIAMLNMMKAQYQLTKGLLDITSNILNSDIENCKPTARYTTYEDTKRYIKKHQPHQKERVKKSRTLSSKSRPK